MGDAVFERQGVDEWLERRTGRADRQGHVDGARAIPGHVVRAPDLGPHLARGVVDRHDGDRQLRVEAFQAFAGERFQARLKARVDREAMDGLLRLRGHRRLRGMRRNHRKGVSDGRQQALGFRSCLGRG